MKFLFSATVIVVLTLVLWSPLDLFVLAGLVWDWRAR